MKKDERKKTMNDIPRQKLQYIISQFGRVICDEPRRCEAMLRDLCPENKREINLLVGAAKERVAADLMTASDAVPKEILLARLTRRLYDNLGMAEEFAHWAVESWALALGVISGPMPGQPVQKSGKTATPPRPAVTSPDPESVWADPLTDMEFIKVPGGTFMMGDILGDNEYNKYDDEKPVHKVRLSGFYLGKYPVTQEQWEAVMGNNPSRFQEGGDYPVEKVSWDDAKKFIVKLSKMNDWRYAFRLPSEAKWEYAARSGGKKERYAEGDDIDAVAWYGDNSDDSTHPVGQKTPNGLGLYDMSGNVYEWCQDWYGEYSSYSVKNPVGPSTGSRRVSRGGSWCHGARSCRSADRYGHSPGLRLNYLGFRLALSPGQQ